MKKYIVFILIAIMASLGASAQKEGNKAERERWFREMRQFKHEFIAKELDLTKEQQ